MNSQIPDYNAVYANVGSCAPCQQAHMPGYNNNAMAIPMPAPKGELAQKGSDRQNCVWQGQPQSVPSSGQAWPGAQQGGASSGQMWSGAPQGGAAPEVLWQGTVQQGGGGSPSMWGGGTQQPEAGMGAVTPSTPATTGQLMPITDLTQPAPMTAESTEFLNGFLRTQIGKRVRVDFLVGTNTFLDRSGLLLGVGANYILLREASTDDLLVCDFFNIKFVTIFY